MKSLTIKYIYIHTLLSDMNYQILKKLHIYPKSIKLFLI